MIAAPTSANNTIAAPDWLWLEPGTAAAISNMLAAPILRDAPRITWYAAGAKNTWLRITKTDGAVQLHTFAHASLGLEPREMYKGDFRPRLFRPEDERFVPDDDLANNLYAISQMALVAYDAWHDNKWALHDEVLTLLSEHVPTLAQAFVRAKRTEGIRNTTERASRCAAHNALHEINAIEALSDEPRGQAMLDPWFRAQQMLRVAAQGLLEGGGARETTLYKFEGEKPSYMLVVPQETECSNAFNMWLDENMNPLLVDYEHNAEACYLDNAGIAWEHPRPNPTTVQGWQQGFDSMNATGIFDSLLSGQCRTTSPTETLAAIEQWIHNGVPMQPWNNVNNDEAIVHLGHWALHTWMAANPEMGPMLHSLLPALDPGGAASQLDAWRQFIVLAKNQKEAPSLGVESQEFGALVSAP